jgi:hypothetical protein
MRLELDGPVSAVVEAAAHVAAELEQRKDIGKGVHRTSIG